MKTRFDRVKGDSTIRLERRWWYRTKSCDKSKPKTMEQ